jgi:hypothetical protein
LQNTDQTFDSNYFSQKVTHDGQPKVIEPLKFEKHKTLLYTDLKQYGFSENIHYIPIYNSEIIPLSRHCPILFPGPKWPAPRLPFSLFALCKSHKNRFVGDQGQWLMDYIPILIRSYPFGMRKEDASHSDTLVVEKTAPHFLSPKGEPLFLDKNTDGEILKKRIQLLNTASQEKSETELFVKLIDELGLLTPKIILANKYKKEQNYYSGFCIINKKKFNELDETKFHKLKRCNALPLIYAHLASLDRFDRLATPIEEFFPNTTDNQQNSTQKAPEGQDNKLATPEQQTNQPLQPKHVMNGLRGYVLTAILASVITYGLLYHGFSF